MLKPLHLLLLASCSIASAYSQTESPAVLVNTQGLAQRDLSVRGGSYADAPVSLNGLKLKVPYSAHFNAGLPLAGHLYAEGTVLPQEDALQTSAGIGTKEYYSSGISAFSSGVGGYLEWEKARQVDYDANDYARFSGGAHVQYFENDWQLDLIGAGQNKEYGAQGYYGIPSDVYAEEQTEDALLLFGAVKGDLEDSFLRASAAWRQFDTRYRIPVSNFVNDVRSRFGAVAVEGRTLEIQHIALNLRGDLEHEETDRYDRTRGSIQILPEARFERFMLKAGLDSVFQSSESAEWLPVAGLDWFVTDNATLYAIYSETVQQPDFQTLYYSDPFHTANRSLKMQKTQHTELGLRQFFSENLDWHAAAFHRKIEKASDWIIDSATDSAWAATDLGTLEVFGAEAQFNYYPADELELSIFYQWVHKEDRDVYAGLYELDYPEHLLNLTGHWNFAPDFTLFYSQILRRQADHNYRSGSDFGADASIGLHWVPPFAHNARFSFRVDNLWGSDFQAIPGLQPRDTTATTGITVQW